ncbi:MAG: CvpA family protein [bacterium]|nr:MAG: CvpA family protein [bacterium]
MQLFDGNYIDLVIILVLSYFAITSLRYGFWVVFADFLAFLTSLFLSLTLYKYTAEFLRLNFSINASISNAIGFLFTAIILESILSYMAGFFLQRLPEKIKKHKLSRFLGVIPGLGEGLVLISFILTLVVALPIKPQVKSDVVDSKIGGVILEKTTVLSGAINEVFGGVINDSLTYFTVNPGSRDSIDLTVTSYNLIIDEKAENEMFQKVNEERKNSDVAELEWDTNLVFVGRAHARDMWERKYFSHISPDGKDVGDRLTDAKVVYYFAGENLALAPTTLTAHTGLMNSKGHRENLLDSRFTKIGIGVYDNGVYGKMFVQVFKD